MKVLMLVFNHLALYPGVRNSVGSIAEPPVRLRPRIERVAGGFDVYRDDGLVTFVPDSNIVEAIYEFDPAPVAAAVSEDRKAAIAAAAKRKK